MVEASVEEFIRKFENKISLKWKKVKKYSVGEVEEEWSKFRKRERERERNVYYEESC